MTKISRYQRLIDALEIIEDMKNTRYGISIDEIVKKYEISRRTCYRLINAILIACPYIDVINIINQKKSIMEL